MIKFYIQVLERLFLMLMFGSGRALMPRIERKYCLINTSYVVGLYVTFWYYFIFDRIVCVSVIFLTMRTLSDAYYKEFECH